jgi:hypothetical protein
LPDDQLQTVVEIPLIGIILPAEHQASSIFSPSHSPPPPPLPNGSSLVLRI